MRIMDLEEFEQTKVNITDDVSELPDKVLVNIITGVRAQTSEYVYPATKDKVGGIKVGKGLIIKEDGELSTEVTSESLQQSLPKIPTKLSEFENDKEFITDTVNNLKNYYNKKEIENILIEFPKLGIEFVDKLPEVGIKRNTFYFVKDLSGNDKDLYAEYVYIGSLPNVIKCDGNSLDKIYFNTKLSVSQVVDILSNSGINYVVDGSTKSYVIASNVDFTKSLIVNIHTTYNIFGIGLNDTITNTFTPYFFNDYNETYKFSGWNPSISNPVFIGLSNTSLNCGLQNNLLLDLVSSTPYEEGHWELLGTSKLDTSQFALKSELPTRVSQLQNDSQFITKEFADNTYAKKGETNQGGFTEVPVASSSVLGGIKTGYGNSQKGFYGVKVNEENRAYVMAPAVEFSPQNLTKEEKGVARDNIEALGRDQAKELFQPKGNYITENNLPIASKSKLGVVKPGNGLDISEDGILSVNSSNIEANKVKWDNITDNPISVTDIKISV